MVDITIFEVHLDGSEFTANAPWDKGEETDEPAGIEIESDESGGLPIGLVAVAGLVALVVLGVAAKKFRGGDTDLDTIEADLA